MPLVLLFIDRAQRRSLAHCLSGATVVYAMSVLAGHGQSYVYMGVLAISYGLFLSVISAKSRRARLWDEWLRWQHWRPLIVAFGSILLSAGIAAFQLLETLRAARRSIRSELSYSTFGEGSFTIREALLSIGAPLYHYVDTSGYVAPLALACVLVAIICSVRGRIRDARVWFWLAVAVVAFLIMVGTNTPLYRLVYQLPVLNQFRVPSRHSFEWTMALGVLAAFGWDALAIRLEGRAREDARYWLVALVLAILSIVVGVLWWRGTQARPDPNPNIYTSLAEPTYWRWKLAYTAIILILAWWIFRLAQTRWRTVALVIVMGLSLFVEQHATISCWWGGLLSLPAARFQFVTPTTRYLMQFAPAENRVYTRSGLFAEEFTPQPRLDAPNLTALYGLQNAAGMEPLILERYSRALGGVGPDSVTPRPGFSANDDLFEAHSHVFDILNIAHVVSFTDLKPYIEPMIYKDRVTLSDFDLRTELPPGASVRLTGAPAARDELALVTTMANSVDVPQGSVVGRIKLIGADGKITELNLRAGIDTAEWAHERPDVRANIRHQLAPIFAGYPGDEGNSFTAYRYWARLPLAGRPLVKNIEITNLAQHATLVLAKATLYDSIGNNSSPLARDPRSEFWSTVYDQDKVLISRNARACPRVWLVAQAEAVDSEEALHRIRGESVTLFDPRRTALLEVAPNELPALPGGDLVATASAHITKYEPRRLVIETDAATATVLVVSEVFYPGWVATVDGQASKISVADYLLRGVLLSPGHHQIEMRYTAPAARAGALISGVTLALLLALAAYAFVFERRKDM
jgi:membrane protein YfhO